ncbi:MAG: methionine synthase [Geodermatophilaceae bacterium]|nr:methionine synthase [Geodermatophilaceae bacterium]
MPTGVATGVGSLPGTDPVDAVATVFGELPDFPHLPELPARGPGAAVLGRGATFLVDLAVDLQPAGWRMVPRPGRDMRRSFDLIARDLDALQEHAVGYVGPLKVQAAGPWTLVAGIERHLGDKLLGDAAAVRDLGQSLGEGLAAHLADLRKRVPGAQLVLQLDEPSLPAVLAGRVRTASGFGTLRRPEQPEADVVLRSVLECLGDVPVIVHCCAPDPPFGLFAGLGVAGVSVDLSLLSRRADDDLGVAVESGVVLVLGVVPTVPVPMQPTRPDTAPAPVHELWTRLGFPVEQLVDSVVVSPRCGLAGADPEYARYAMEQARGIAAHLLD